MSRRARSAGALVFAYGSNLDDEQMLRRCPSAVDLGRARLRGHRLLFSGFSRGWGGAVATVAPSPKHRVEGALYRVTLADLERLDGHEGTPWCYERLRLSVRLRGSDGRADRDVIAEVYVKADPTPGCPSRTYLEAIARGYHRLGIKVDGLVDAAVESARAAAQMDALAAVAAAGCSAA